MRRHGGSPGFDLAEAPTCLRILRYLWDFPLSSLAGGAKENSRKRIKVYRSAPFRHLWAATRPTSCLPSFHQGSSTFAWTIRRRTPHRAWSPVQITSKNTRSAPPPKTVYSSCRTRVKATERERAAVVVEPVPCVRLSGLSHKLMVLHDVGKWWEYWLRP